MKIIINTTDGKSISRSINSFNAGGQTIQCQNPGGPDEILQPQMIEQIIIDVEDEDGNFLKFNLFTSTYPTPEL